MLVVTSKVFLLCAIGAMKVSVMTISIMTLNIRGLHLTLSLSDSIHANHHNNALPFKRRVIMLSILINLLLCCMLCFIYCHVECHYAECCYAECCNAKGHYAECCGTLRVGSKPHLKNIRFGMKGLSLTNPLAYSAHLTSTAINFL